MMDNLPDGSHVVTGVGCADPAVFVVHVVFGEGRAGASVVGHHPEIALSINQLIKQVVGHLLICDSDAL